MSEGPDSTFSIHDLGREVRRLNQLVAGLHEQLEELNDRHARRWMTTIIANVALVLVVVTLIVGYLSVRDFTEKLDQETRARAEANCEAIGDSRDIVRDILVVMTTGTTDYSHLPKEQREFFERARERSQQRTSEALSLLSQVDC